MPNIVADLAAFVTVEGVAAATAELTVFDSAIERTRGASLGASLGAAAIGVAAVLGFKHAIGDAENFQFMMQTIRAKIDNIGDGVKMTNAQYDAMSNKALQLGRDTIFGATDAANAMLYLVRAGMDVKTIIDSGAQAVLDFAGATDGAIPDAANILSTTMNQFKDQGISAAHTADILSVATLKSGHTMSEFGTGMSYVGQVMDLLGVSEAATAATVSFLTLRMGDASRAGTGLRTAVDHLLNPTKAVGEWMAANNFTMVDAQGNFIGLAALADELKTKTEGLTDAQKTQLALQMGGQRGQQVLAEMMRDGGDQIRKYTAEVDKSGTAHSIMAEKMDSLRGSMHQLMGSLNSMWVILGLTILPAVRLLVEAFTQLINVFINLTPPVQHFIAAALSIAGVVAIFQSFGAVAHLIFGAGGGAIMTGFADALGALLLPLTLIAAAFALIYEIWTNNFLGAADAVKTLISDVTDKFNQFETGLTPLQQTLQSLGMLWNSNAEGMSGFEAAIATILYYFDQIAGTGTLPWFLHLLETIEHGTQVFQRLEREGVSPVSAALRGFAVTLRQLGLGDVAGFFTTLGKSLQSAIDTFNNFKLAGFGQFLSTMYAIAQFFRDEGLGGVADFFTKLAGVLEAHDWGGLLGLIAGGLASIASTVFNWTWTVAAPALAGWALEWAGDIWGWFEAQIGLGGQSGDGTGGAGGPGFAGVAIGLGAWTLDTVVPTVTGWIKDFARDAWRALVIAAGIAGDLIADMHAWTLDVGLPKLGGDIKTVMGRFGPWLLGEIEKGYSGTVHAGDVTFDFTKVQVNAASKSNAANAIKSDIVGAVNALNTFGSDVAKAVYEKVGGWTGWLSLITGGSYDIGGKVGSALHEAILAGVRKLAQADWGQIFHAIAGFMLVAVAAAPFLLFNVATAFISGFTGFVVGVIGGPDAVQKFRDFAAKVAQNILTALRGIEWRDMGNAIVDGLKAGIDLVWAHLAANIKQWIRDFIGWWKSELGISSPSTVFKGIGSDIINGLKDGLEAAWGGVKNWAEKALAWFKHLFSSVAGFFGFGGGGGQQPPGKMNVSSGDITGPDLGFGQPTTHGLTGPDAAGAGGGILGMIQNAMGGGSGGSGFAATVGQMGTDAGNAFNQNLYKGLLAAQNTAAAVWAAMKSAADTFKTDFGTKATDAGNLFNTNVYVGLLAAQTKTAPGVFNAILAATDTFATGFKTRATSIGNDFNTNIYVGLLAAQTTAANVWAAMETAANTFGAHMRDIATGIGNNFNQNLWSPGLQAAEGTVQATMNSIADIIGGSTANIYALGANIGNSLANGIASTTSAVIAAATSLSQAAQAATTTTNAIHSPSEVYRQYGRFIGEGFALGMDDSRPLVSRSASGMLGAPTIAAGAGAGNVHTGDVIFNIYSNDPHATANEVARKLNFARGTALGGIAS